MIAPQYREVIPEDSLDVEGQQKGPGLHLSRRHPAEVLRRSQEVRREHQR